jgi:hypothetical protein
MERGCGPSIRATMPGITQSPGDVIGAALAMLYEEIEDGITSETRVGERFSLDEIEEELRALGKIK